MISVTKWLIAEMVDLPKWLTDRNGWLTEMIG